MTRRILPIVVAGLLLPLSACDNSDPEEAAPSLIPEAAFQLDTELFSGAPKSAAGINFAAGVFRVWPVSLVLTAHMVLPAAVTAAAVSADPVFEDGAWRWTSTTTHGIQSVSFTLVGTPASPGTDWQMLVSYSDNGVQLVDYELFNGHTENNGTEGEWSLYYPVNGVRTNVLNATWNNDSETDRILTLSVPATAPEAGGDSVTYTVDGDQRVFQWLQSEAGITHLVEWDAVTGSGSITASNFNNGVQACWDTSQDDVAC